MISLLEPIQKDSLINIFIQKFENLILSGQIQIGKKLPSERELAKQLDVSRQVVHEGLLDLEVKGLVSLRTRSGWIVNDYRKTGSLLLLNSLFEYGEGELDRKVAESLFKARILIETEAAAEAAENRSESEIKELESIIEKEKLLSGEDIENIVLLDFEFHLAVASASGNIVYPLLLNSCRAVYTNLTRIFYRLTELDSKIFETHEEICRSIRNGEKDKSGKLMRKLLTDGEAALRRNLC
ncbi:MAG: FadR family transcriptional regulator [Spirochaetales bacterium]|nr:FadR family transcriptional regulator [Spirochaetales bacterium]